MTKQRKGEEKRQWWRDSMNEQQERIYEYLLRSNKGILVNTFRDGLELEVEPIAEALGMGTDDICDELTTMVNDPDTPLEIGGDEIDTWICWYAPDKWTEEKNRRYHLNRRGRCR